LKHFTLEAGGEKLFEAELTDLRALGDLDEGVFAKP
jgi:hypothetical protein